MESGQGADDGLGHDGLALLLILLGLGLQGPELVVAGQPDKGRMQLVDGAEHVTYVHLAPFKVAALIRTQHLD